MVNEDIVEVAAADFEKLKNIISGMEGFKSMKEQNSHLYIYYPQGTADLEAINHYCYERGIVLRHLQLKKKSLEAKFFELTNN